MNKSDSINELAAALSAAQGELGHAPMNNVNAFLKNKYADLGSVIEAAKPVLSEHNLAVTQLVGGDGKTVSVETVMMHSSGQWISETMSLFIDDAKGKSEAQAAGSIITYLRRYALSAILGMYADEDTDGNGPQKPQAQQVAKPAVSGGEDKPERKPRPPAFQEPPANMHPSITPALRGRWDYIVAEAKANGVDMNFEIGDDDAETLTIRANAIKAAIASMK